MTCWQCNGTGWRIGTYNYVDEVETCLTCFGYGSVEVVDDKPMPKVQRSPKRRGTGDGDSHNGVSRDTK